VLPEDFKKNLEERLRAEAKLRFEEKKSKLEKLHREKLAALEAKYEEAVEQFASQLR